MLKLILVLMPIAAATLTGQSSIAPSHKTTATVAKAKAVTASPSGIQGIPAGAVKIDETTYRWQEKGVAGQPGKVWLYRRNPFGVSRVEESEAAKIGQPVKPIEVPTVATDLGDSYKFERSGPFGSKIWTKKKNELNDDERAIVRKSPVTLQKAAN